MIAARRHPLVADRFLCYVGAMSSRHLILLFLLASLSRLPAEPEPEKPVQNVAVTLFGSLLPGLKITRLGTAEPALMAAPDSAGKTNSSSPQSRGIRSMPSPAPSPSNPPKASSPFLKCRRSA